MQEQKAEILSQYSHELVQMGLEDWSMRGAHQDSQKKEIITKEVFEKVYRENTARLKEIIKQIGWPTISKVGEEASYAAWLLVQHADLDVDFQKDCLLMMEEAHRDRDVLPANLAYLTDRVAVNLGEEQVYGTQWHQNENGLAIPRPIKDAERLEERRVAMGLEPFAAYSEKMRGEYTYPPTYKNPMIGRFPISH